MYLYLYVFIKHVLTFEISNKEWFIDIMMLLVELKATADLDSLDQQHSLYSPKTYNLVYNNNVILLLYIGFRNLQGHHRRLL